MTELFINNQKVVLPTNLNLTLTSMNPSFSDGGAYSLDLTLSLSIGTNAIIFGHMNRINILNVAEEKLSATLIVDNRVILRGSAVIISITDIDVKIQLIAGNAEFNFVGSDKKIRDLDLGSATPYQSSGEDPDKEISDAVIADLPKTYPERNWNLYPYAATWTDQLTKGKDAESDEDKGYNMRPPVGNCYGITGDGDPSKVLYPVYSPNYSGQVPQPFFLFIINQIIKALGYNLLPEDNDIEQTDFAQAYIVNGVQTLEFAKMLPDWTVTEFFQEIEKLFNCTLIIDNISRKVQIRLNVKKGATLLAMQKIDIRPMDAYEIDVDDKNHKDVSNSNIGYSLDGNTNGLFMRLANKFKSPDASKKTNFTIAELAKNVLSTDTDKLFSVTDDSSTFIRYQSSNSYVGNTIKIVDSFHNLMNNNTSSELDIEFKIVPATMLWAYIEYAKKGDLYYVQYPIAEDADSLNGDYLGQSYKINIQQSIEGSSKSTVIPEKIRLAFFTGIASIPTSDENLRIPTTYPISAVEKWPESLSEIVHNQPTGITMKPYMSTNPFRLENLYDRFYHPEGYIVDTTKKYSFSFILPTTPDINAQFNINHKLFRCIKLERIITINGFNQIIKGEFYPYNPIPINQLNKKKDGDRI